MVRNLLANAGDVRDVGSIPGSGRSPGGGHGNPLQYSCLESPMDREAWGGATFHRGCRELDTTEQLKLLGILWLLRNNFTELPVSDKANLKPQWSRKNKTNQDRSIVKSECEQKHILQTTKCPNMPLFLVNMNDCCFFTDYSFSLTSCLSRRLHENAQ